MNLSTHRVCRKCEATKLHVEFTKNLRCDFGISHTCKDCTNKMQRAWVKSIPPEKLQDRVLARLHSQYKERAKKYGMSVGELSRLEHLANGKCQICSRVPSGRGAGGKLHVDHSHTTGKVRGMLCSQCNTVLGLAGDNVAVLTTMVSYLCYHT